MRPRCHRPEALPEVPGPHGGAFRRGEGRAVWDEMDPDGATWTIPASRMKSGEEHRVPLSAQALEVLEAAHHLRDGSPLCFPSPLRPGRMLSDVTLTKVLRTNGLADRATVHGFRTSFRTWTMEQTQAPWEVAEAALAHRLGSAVVQAYARSDLFEQRRTLMQRWGGLPRWPVRRRRLTWDRLCRRPWLSRGPARSRTPSQLSLISQGCGLHPHSVSGEHRSAGPDHNRGSASAFAVTAGLRRCGGQADVAGTGIASHGSAISPASPSVLTRRFASDRGHMVSTPEQPRSPPVARRVRFSPPAGTPANLRCRETATGRREG